MKTIRFYFFITSFLFILSGCRALKAPVIVGNVPAQTYQYVYIQPTTELTSGASNLYTGAMMTKSVNPSDVIAGELIKNGFVILPELKPELIDRTLIVNYGESDRHNRGLGYTIEVTIQFISAKSHEVVCTCTAEGQGETEADDIRQAIRRALSSLFEQKE